MTRVFVEMVCVNVFRLNNFPPAYVVLGKIIPQSIVKGAGVDYKKHCHAEFGEYVCTYKEQYYSMAIRTAGDIVLCPTSNTQGGYYFYNITNGKVLNRCKWTPLSMTQGIIGCMQVL